MEEIMSTADESQTVPKLGIGIVGCGLMGVRRARIIHPYTDQYLVIVADIDEKRAKDLAQEVDCQASSNWQDVVTNDDVDIVIVSVPNKIMADVVVAAFENGKHVLCEKPQGRNPEEARRMVDAAHKADRLLKIGFNKRYHPAVWKTHALFAEGVVGDLMYIRAIFGHGARPGYEKEWYADADMAGGGALLDIGIHLVDQCMWYLGAVEDVFAIAPAYFWDLSYFDNGQQLDDNAFITLRREDGVVAHVHASWTQWKNRFSFEAFGKDGFLRLEGLGGSYGPAELTYGRRRPESGPPIIETFGFEGPDNSLQVEWDEFINVVRDGGEVMANGDEGLETMRVMSALYQSAHTGQVVKL